MKNIKMKKIYGLLDTEEKVRKFEQDLVDSTKESFSEFSKAKIKSWHKARHVVFD